MKTDLTIILRILTEELQRNGLRSLSHTTNGNEYSILHGVTISDVNFALTFDKNGAAVVPSIKEIGSYLTIIGLPSNT